MKEMPPHSNQEGRVIELNPYPKLMDLLEQVDGLDKDDAGFLARLNQKIGDDELGNVLFGLRHILSAISDPQKYLDEVQAFKDKDIRLYDGFHEKRKSSGKSGLVSDDEVSWGDFAPEILNMDRDALLVYLEQKYEKALEESDPEYIRKHAASDFYKAIAPLSIEERNQLFRILGITSASEETVVFADHLVASPQAAEQHSDFVKSIAARLSEVYKESVSGNPQHDPAIYDALERANQRTPSDPEMLRLSFEKMEMRSLIRGLIAENVTAEFRQMMLSVFLLRCQHVLAPSTFRLFERQVRGLETQNDWQGIVRLAMDTLTL